VSAATTAPTAGTTSSTATSQSNGPAPLQAPPVSAPSPLRAP
jgi:hypothetical protein